MKTPRTLILTLLALALVPLTAPSAAAPPETRPAIDGIIEAFGHADIVTLGERPWGKVDSDFRHSLIADPRFGDAVDDIVVEFANARHQALLDRYVLDLAAIHPDSLRVVWQDASEPGAWDSPVYAYLLDVVRRANRLRVPEKRIRVVAGEPPIDWSQVQSSADVRAYGARGAHALDVIAREVVARQRRALVIYGLRNFFRRDRGMSADGNLTTNLEARFPSLKVYVIGTVPERSPAGAALDSTIATATRPVLVSLANSRIGTWPAARIFPYAPGGLGDIADGLLYLGPVDDSKVRPSDRVLRDPVYVQEVARRKALLGR